MSKAKGRVARSPPVVEQDKDKDNEVVLDLASFVTQVERFSTLIEPFAFVFYFIDDIRRWRFPNITIAFWIVTNICCFVLTQGAVFILASCVVVGIASLSLCQLHTRIFDKYFPKTKHDASMKPAQEETNTLETIQNFQYSLIQMHDFVVKSNEYLTYIYAVLKWDDAVPALIYHAEVCLSLLCMVVFPVRWNCFLFFNWFFLCHPIILKTGCSYWMGLIDSFTKKNEQRNGAVVTDNASAVSQSSGYATITGTTLATSAVSHGANTTSMFNVSLIDFYTLSTVVTDDASGSQGYSTATSGTTPASSTVSHDASTTSTSVAPKNKLNADVDSLDGDDKDEDDVDLIEMSSSVDESLSKIEPAPQRPGMVARLLELKKRRAQMANENCFGCHVSFSSILKRRHYCRHCGNSFCHKCCNHKVPRSVFGATSPAASKETVLVCNACHTQLTSSGDSTPAQGAKARSESS